MRQDNCSFPSVRFSWQKRRRAPIDHLNAGRSGKGGGGRPNLLATTACNSSRSSGLRLLPKVGAYSLIGRLFGEVGGGCERREPV
jgi:hypothetical protein